MYPIQLMHVNPTGKRRGDDDAFRARTDYGKKTFSQIVQMRPGAVSDIPDTPDISGVSHTSPYIPTLEMPGIIMVKFRFNRTVEHNIKVRYQKHKTDVLIEGNGVDRKVIAEDILKCCKPNHDVLHVSVVNEGFPMINDPAVLADELLSLYSVQAMKTQDAQSDIFPNFANLASGVVGFSRSCDRVSVTNPTINGGIWNTPFSSVQSAPVAKSRVSRIAPLCGAPFNSHEKIPHGKIPHGKIPHETDSVYLPNTRDATPDPIGKILPDDIIRHTVVLTAKIMLSGPVPDLNVVTEEDKERVCNYVNESLGTQLNWRAVQPIIAAITNCGVVDGARGIPNVFSTTAM